jgi:hypothetical protein
MKGLRELSERYSKIRIAIFLSGLILSLTCIELIERNPYRIAAAVGSVALIAFLGSAYLHVRVKRGINRHEIWHGLKAAQLARIRLDWVGVPPSPLVRQSIEHPFEIDLDITGERSLHRLIDTAISLEGSTRLRNWLLRVEPRVEQILRNQSLVRELAPMTLFREKLLLHAKHASRFRTGKSLKEKWEATRLIEWLQHYGAAQSVRPVLLFLTFLAAADAAVFTLVALQLLPVYFTGIFLAYLVIVFFKQVQVKKAYTDALSLESTLRELQAVFHHLESWSYAKAPELSKLCAPFLEPELRPSAQLKSISRVISAMSVRSNPVVWLLLNAVAPWDFFFVHRLNRCKAELSSSLPVWLDALFEIEALNSLANFAYLNPRYVFPRMLGNGRSEMMLRVRNIGHPLIPIHERICNDFSLDEHSRIALITGSNMAGKSSFLRTLGVNLCLTNAGAPVAAESFETSLFRVFACMRINDSVTDGFSYFYAEVKRMKALLTAMEDDQSTPLFFLLDEIFRGTNNRERLIGARAYVRALAALRGAGAIATHDLELVKLTDEDHAIVNYHFREEVLEERMVFDYKIRSGPCPTTNALKIMEMVGLPT